MEELILHKAKELFFSYGLKSVSMDDLARQAGISKKTIYQFFSDRNELVDQVVDDLVSCHHTQLNSCKHQSLNAVDEVLMQSTLSLTSWASVNRSFFYELERSFPVSWSRIMEYKKATLRLAIIENIERGIAEKLYREDIDKELTADLRIQQFQNAIDPASFTYRNSTSAELMQGLTQFYLNGIATQKGKQILNIYLAKNEK